MSSFAEPKWGIQILHVHNFHLAADEKGGVIPSEFNLGLHYSAFCKELA